MLAVALRTSTEYNAWMGMIDGDRPSLAILGVASVCAVWALC
jgi:hypothetical protein